jgi:hypothetical protein
LKVGNDPVLEELCGPGYFELGVSSPERDDPPFGVINHRFEMVGPPD